MNGENGDSGSCIERFLIDVFVCWIFDI